MASIDCAKTTARQDETLNLEFGVTYIRDLTVTVFYLTSGSWKEKTFKPYNFDALGIMPDSGHLHPLLKVRAEFRQIFIEMG